MGAVTTSLAQRARSIFADLGYDVSRDGAGFRAERKWRVVDVTVSEPDAIPTDGRFRCFVTGPDAATRTYRRVATREPDYEWAVIAVHGDGDYEILEGTDPDRTDAPTVRPTD